MIFCDVKNKYLLFENTKSAAKKLFKIFKKILSLKLLQKSHTLLYCTMRIVLSSLCFLMRGKLNFDPFNTMPLYAIGTSLSTKISFKKLY